MKFVTNGINALTGTYDLSARSMAEFAHVAQSDEISNAEARRMKSKVEYGKARHLGTIEGVDPKQLSESGWGVIFPAIMDPEIYRQLQPLLEHRKHQAEHLYYEYRDVEGYLTNESKNEFLERHGAGVGPVDPEFVPYYLLLVGGPTEIPFDFQYQLDVDYAVGRLYFDNIEDYGVYARSVINTEQRGMIKDAPKLTLAGTTHADDPLTKVSRDNLILPLANKLNRKHSTWEVETLVNEDAKKPKLMERLAGPRRASLFFSATHGMMLPCGHERQRNEQGGLICGEWPGPKRFSGPLPKSHFLVGDDLKDSDSLEGLIAFFFNCFGAGTPQRDDFWFRKKGEKKKMAPAGFIARLPQQMLAHPKGGALAVVAHVERSYTHSFTWGKAGSQIQAFSSTLTRLMNGFPIGAALEYINMRYAALATELAAILAKARRGKQPDPEYLIRIWSAGNDAKNYILLGDPAVRIQ